jgi:uracil-DNA glycosylase family 4
VSARELERLARAIPRCTACPELRAYCARVAREKRRAFRAEEYWGRPVTGFGDPKASLWILGLAPAAHGGNRTGRIFTGDRSGDFLFAGLHRAGLANQPTSAARGDGLRLSGVWISAALRCAPPGNRPTPEELENCTRWLDAERAALADVRVLFCLGGLAWNAALDLEARHGVPIRRPRPRFAHGARCELGDRTLVGCYHVSQQNTFTGRLTPAMLDAQIAAALKACGSRAAGSRSSPRSRTADPRGRSRSP